MNIKRVIKIYFVFVMTIVSMGALSFNNTVGSMMASVLDIENSNNSGVYNYLSKISGGDLFEKFFVTNRINNGEFRFSIEKDPSKTFVYPGEQNFPMMGFFFEASDYLIEIKSLKLKIMSDNPDYIKKALLMNGDKIISTGKKVGEYFIFEKIDFEIEKSRNDALYLVVDVSGNVPSGKRIRMDIETPEDFKIEVGGEAYQVSEYYPVEGKYLSVVGKRYSQ